LICIKDIRTNFVLNESQLNTVLRLEQSFLEAQKSKD